MKSNQIFAGAARSCRSLLCLLAATCLIFSARAQVDKFNTDKIKRHSLVKRIQEIYTSQIGVREKKVNSGPEVEKYLAYVGLKKGNPWCAAFVCWVFGEAGVD